MYKKAIVSISLIFLWVKNYWRAGKLAEKLFLNMHAKNLSCYAVSSNAIDHLCPGLVVAQQKYQ